VKHLFTLGQPSREVPGAIKLEIGRRLPKPDLCFPRSEGAGEGAERGFDKFLTTIGNRRGLKMDKVKDIIAKLAI